ncbi:hypothetical protein JOC85_002850 [Bacillus mesophilus]|uniref:Uncharacterized protein n=1 Tax=Bacillus mesophilus TaxID=1808955 RepID=A0A6M0Q8B3_9BACI|nr:hypothetical protein [Bacillus mesophilus]MBM7662043.1 hypothetical protein [Bacillus mesophilus]NEY72602.1 hypothetical protein [Bacillus mesophilus]
MFSVESLLGVIFSLMGATFIYVSSISEQKLRKRGDFVEQEQMSTIDYLFLINPFELIGFVLGKFPYWVTRSFYFIVGLFCFGISVWFFLKNR